MKLKVALDLDEVVVDLFRIWAYEYKKQAGLSRDEVVKVTHWDPSEDMPLLPKQQIYDMLDKEFLFLDAPPMEGAVVSVRKLINDDRFDIYFLTAARARTAFSEKIEWIRRKFGTEYANRVIGVPTGRLKAVVAESFDVLVDDNMPNVGMDEGRCTRVLFDHPHNKDYRDGFDCRVRSWKELVRLLEMLYAEKESQECKEEGTCTCRLPRAKVAQG